MLGTKNASCILVYMRKLSGKCALTLHSCISITDKAVKVNEQNSDRTPLRIRTEFETIKMLLPEDVAVLNPIGFRVS